MRSRRALDDATVGFLETKSFGQILLWFVLLELNQGEKTETYKMCPVAVRAARAVNLEDQSIISLFGASTSLTSYLFN